MDDFIRRLEKVSKYIEANEDNLDALLEEISEHTANTDQTHHKTTYRKGSKQMPQ